MHIKYKAEHITRWLVAFLNISCLALFSSGCMDGFGLGERERESFNKGKQNTYFPMALPTNLLAARMSLRPITKPAAVITNATSNKEMSMIVHKHAFNLMIKAFELLQSAYPG